MKQFYPNLAGLFQDADATRHGRYVFAHLRFSGILYEFVRAVR